MKYAILVVLLLASCGTLQDANTPDIPKDVAALHGTLNQVEKAVVIELETRVLDVTQINKNDDILYMDSIQFIKVDLGKFSQWLRKSGLDANLYEATVVRLRVWEDMQYFFCIQEDAYLKFDLPLDEGTKAEVLKYLAFIAESSDKTEIWIDEKGVQDD